MPFIESNQSQYFYMEKGDSNPIVLLHGFTGSSASWSEIIDCFSNNYRTIAIDLPGHGKTRIGKRPQNMQLIAEDILSICDELGLFKPHLIGYSMGGRLALFMALHFPNKYRSLVLESASPGLDSAQERSKRMEQDEKLIQQLECEPIATFVDRWQSLPLFATQNLVNQQKFQQQRAQRLLNSPTKLADSLRWMGTGQQPSLWHRLGELKIPNLLLAGILDQKYASINKKMVEMIPNGELHIFPSTGHNIHFERPFEYFEVVQRFLKGWD